jgi:molybdenum cofactor cytidylyltransferase
MSPQLKIACIVPASGVSRRMGKNKLTLPFGQSTVLETTLAALAPISFTEKVFVSRKEDGGHPEFRWIDGSRSNSMHETLKRGLAVLNPCDAVMIALADQPWLKTSDYENLICEYFQALKNGFSLIRPWNIDQPGNPSIIHSKFFPEIFQEPDQDRGFSYLFQRHSIEVKKIPLHQGFFQDLDSPEDYQCWNS